MSRLFSPLALREVVCRNRIFVSPMCMYSSLDGLANDWHLVHLGSRAVGGAGLVMAEATAVCPEGRISPLDTGMWSPAHAAAFRRTTAFIAEQGAVPAVQLAHAGRKASTAAPWHGGGPVGPEAGGWQPIGPSALAFDEVHPVPREMTEQDVDRVVEQFAAATRWSAEAGFTAVEIHMAHGYLLHEFLSPLTNRRTDRYGGSMANRMRLPLRVAEAVRESYPAGWPVLVRISATDWVEGGWDLPQSIELCQKLRGLGIDLIDASSGGLVPGAKMKIEPGYQVPFAEAIRREAGIATGAVGLIVQPEQAEAIVAEERADAVLLAREFLRNPYWPLQAAQALGAEVAWPKQYARGR